MSAYEWPSDDSDDDDAGARGEFVARYRTDDLVASLATARGQSLSPPPVAPGVAPPPPPPAAPTTRVEMWVPLGPSSAVHGQAAGKPRISGRTRALYVSPDGRRIYAASGLGGVWYSGDAGTTWSSVGGFAASAAPGSTRPAHRFSCGSILVIPDPGSPNDESLDQVFVGTGEMAPSARARPGSMLGGVGVLVATGPAAGVGPDPWTVEAPNLADNGVSKIVVDPASTTIVAATSIGLFQRPVAAGSGVAWARVAAAPFDDLNVAISDIVWTDAVSGGPPARLWVWVRRGEESGLWVRDAAAPDFLKVSTPGSRKRRARIAAATPPTTLYVVNDRYSRTSSNALGPALYQIDSSSNAAPTATRVRDVPDFLGSQGFWDLALAVDPSDPNVVVVGGKAIIVANPAGDSFPRDGAIFSGTVGLVAARLSYASTGNPTMIGVGCHADVHDLHFADGGKELWAACDGGVFRSQNPGQQVGFVAKNDGVSAFETNYIAVHPICEGRVVVGLQDNGILERASSATWWHTGGGDGGGVVFDPTEPDRYLRQFHGGRWTSSDGNQFNDLLRRGSSLKGRKEEISDSAFYSRPDAVSVSDPLRDSQVAIGTTRVWYSQDWGSSFVTLPHASDPIGLARYKRRQDDFGQSIRVCKWDGPDRLWVLGDDQIHQLVRTTGSDSLLSVGDWSRDKVLNRNRKNKKDSSSSDGPIKGTLVWTDIAVNPNDTPDGFGSFRRGSRGALYMGAVARAASDSDTLWWFDGDETWHPTGLRSEISAPVTALATDPADAAVVYVGTTVGAWVGRRTLATPPTWSWRQIVNGLPEGALEDLALYNHGGLKLLRAAVASRGVWELRLDDDVVDTTYVRAHDDDLRYRSRAIETGRDGVSVRSWHGSPDIRPRLAPSVIAAPASLPWTRFITLPELELRRFQAALRSQSGDDRVRATGIWDLYFEEVLRANGAPVSANIVSITSALWNSVMVNPHNLAEPWGSGPPAEVDLLDLTATMSEGELDEVSCVMPAAPLKVDVVVHHRGLDERDGADVSVTLLRWTRTPADPIPRANDPATWFAGDVPWTVGVAEVLNSTSATTLNPFEGPTGGWRFVGRTTPTRRVQLGGQVLDNLTAGVATFDLDLSPFRNNTVMLLVAVLRAGSDVSLVPAPLREMTLENSGIAVRSLLIKH